MPPLDPAAARRARADMDAELADEGTHDREILLILRSDVRLLHGAATRGTRGGQRRVVLHIDPRRHGPRPLPAVRPARAATPRTSGALSMRLGEGRGLPEARPPRGIELIPESVIAALQAIPLALDPYQRGAQARQVLLLPLDQGVAIVGRRAIVGHTPVMPKRLKLYKYEILDRRRSRALTR